MTNRRLQAENAGDGRLPVCADSGDAQRRGTQCSTGIPVAQFLRRAGKRI